MITRNRFLSLFALVLVTSQLVGAVFVGDLQISSTVITGASTAPVTGGLVFGGGALAANPEWKNKLVVADRGGSSFLEKAEAVQQAGGVGLILVNASNAPFNATLGTGVTSTLPAVAVTLDDGKRLKQQVGQQAAISPTKPDPLALRALANTLAIMERLTAVEAKISSTPPTPPVIVGPGPDDAKAGTTITLVASVEGNPPPTWTWKKNGVIVPTWTSATVTLASLTDNDTGIYTAIAANVAGSAQASHVVNVVP